MSSFANSAALAPAFSDPSSSYSGWVSCRFPRKLETWPENSPRAPGLSSCCRQSCRLRPKKVSVSLPRPSVTIASKIVEPGRLCIRRTDEEATSAWTVT